MDPTKALDHFNLKIVSENDEGIILEGTPKEENKFLSKMRFVFSSETFLPNEVVVFGSGGKQLSDSTITYEKISDVYVPIENSSTVTLPQGSMVVDVLFSNVKVNQKIADSLFEVE